ncbi:dihydroxyacetone kinase subunit DhaK [Thorsellia anophelis]|uniref:Dihydroxyacetone kinase, N-terminal domain n=1 Tax=Thorsellia anophelis DSM 18579 TaxID=1123402 RepID=A0A1I0AGE2_9GAMM|nr:dihydroxyacetone kinase subunit DhaK [Thorsellia anophelis]SES92325.1 dihydroxyacetone kinase, N-terminal domain [Thorsellia anophelis DSM 18579]
MNRIINQPDFVVEDAIEGYVKAHPEYFVKTNNPKVLKSPTAPVANKVGLVTGGGSGHEPAFLGYVGHNMLDAVAIGEIFSSPTAVAFLDAFKAADSGQGVACLYGNYAGDNMNVKMAIKKAQAEGIIVKTVVANDDVASASADEIEKRRGVAGEIFMWKIGAAAAAKGYVLDDVIKVAQKAIDNTRSIGIGLSSCTIPAVGKPNFHIADGQMEIGIGHHGEPGIEVTNTASAKDMANIMLDKILADGLFNSHDEIGVIVSGLGGTPTMELYIYFSALKDLLDKSNIHIHTKLVGNYFTSLDMMGVTLTLIKLDDELKELIDLKADCLAFK